MAECLKFAKICEVLALTLRLTGGLKETCQCSIAPIATRIRCKLAIMVGICVGLKIIFTVKIMYKSLLLTQSIRFFQ